MGESPAPDITKRENKEFGFTVTAQVEQALDKACEKRLFGLSPVLSLNETLLAVLSIWHES